MTARLSLSSLSGNRGESTLDCIRLKDILVFGHYGVSAEERDLGQRLRMNLLLELDLSHAAESDSLKDTVSYEDLYRKAKETAESESSHLLEHLAARVADRVMETWPIVQAVSVSLSKLNLPFPGECREAEVEVRRERA